MFELNTPVEKLYLVGPARAKLLKRLNVETLEDLLFYFPRAHNDLSQLTEISNLKLGANANIKARVLEVKTFRTRVRKFTITHALVEDDTGALVCVWFNQPYLTKILKAQEEFIFSGKVTSSGNKLQLQNPVYEQVKGEQIHTARLVPMYPLTANLTQKQLRTTIKTYLDKVHLPEYLPTEILKSENLLDEDTAVKAFHFPPNQSLLQRAQNRLAFDEIFQTQLRVARSRLMREQKPGFEITMPDHLDAKISSLPFQLTAGQRQALNEILADFKRPYPGNRLLEGDVGSGKTMVAALAAWMVAVNHLQAAFLAPTEVLAQQHYANLLPFFKKDNINVGLLTASSVLLNGNPVSKTTLQSQLSANTLPIVIGTHALLQDAVKFQSLALIIIDEQHRFGVEQRSMLKQNNNPHLLTMSATPIPRTLALTLYGDLDISLLKEIPAGRQPITTRIVAEKNRTKAYGFIAGQITQGRQIFVICPTIDESDTLGVKSATSEFKKLSVEIFPQFKIGLLHSRLKPAQKEEAMRQFQNNELSILVSTSVVEVGVDVPNASVMMIEGAERFGLSQLHQFRGRVGRADHKSYCFLFSEDPDAATNPRLQAVAESQSGFDLAEADLQIRGSGELYGTRQSGYSFKIATLKDITLVERSRQYAQAILASDPDLKRWPQLKQKADSAAWVHLE